MDLSSASRDSHLALRRVERQQWLVETLYDAALGPAGEQDGIRA